MFTFNVYRQKFWLTISGFVLVYKYNANKGVYMSNENRRLGAERTQQLREAVAAKKARNQLIESLGDTEFDWIGFDTVNDIREYLDWAVQNNKAEQWTVQFGGKEALMEHVNKYVK